MSNSIHLDQTVRSFSALGESVLTVLACLVPFLDQDQLHLLPYTMASTLATFPASLQQYTVHLLCTNLLPVIMGSQNKQSHILFQLCITDFDEGSENATYATESTAAILMIVLQQVEQSGP
jgi:hypothetical protein